MQPTSNLGQLAFGDTALLEALEAPFMSNLTPEKGKVRENDDDDEHEGGCKDFNSTLGVDPPATPTVAPLINNKGKNKKPYNQTSETSSRQRKIRINIEVERIIVSMKGILSDIGLQPFV